MDFKDFKTHTLYSVIYSTEAHFLYATSKTEKALYGYYLYFVDDEIDVDHFVTKELVNDRATIFKEMQKGYPKVLIRIIFERLNGLKK